MRKKQVSEMLTALLNVLGNQEQLSEAKNLKKPLRAKLMLALSILILTIYIIIMYVYWNNVDSRILFFEDINFAVMDVLFVTHLIYSANNYKILIDTIKYSIFNNDKYINRSDFNNMIEKARTFSWNIIMIITYGAIVYVGCMCIVPLLLFIFKAINDDYIDLNNITTPIPILKLITTDKSFIIFITSFVLQTIKYIYSVFLILIWLLITSCSITYTFHELVFLSDIIKNMDSNIEDIILTNNNRSSYTESELYNMKLKLFLKTIHCQHLKIIKKVEDINKTLSVLLLVFNQVICFHLTIILYCMIQHNQISAKWKFIMAYLSTLNSYGTTSVMGQFLINKSEDLWNAICMCKWQNKPLWFKHGIRMLLIGTQKPLKLQPASLYVLDLSFLLKVLQVSYSYCNLMLQMNNKKMQNN